MTASTSTIDIATPASDGAALLRRCEADHPGWHRIHLVIALLWAFSQGIATSIEGVTWGLLAAVSLLRLPHTRHTAGRPLRDRAWLLLMTWQLWVVLSAAWAVPGAVDGWNWLRPYRWLITPLLLWPVLALRPWALLFAIGAGAMLQTTTTLAWAWDADSTPTYVSLRGLVNYGSLIWVLAAASVIGFGSIAALTSWRTILGAAMGFMGMAGVFLAASRTLLIGLALAVTVLVLRPRRGLGSSSVLAVISAVALAATVSAWMTQTPAWSRLVAEFQSADHPVALLLDLRSGSHRSGLWRGTAEIIRDRPLLGSGRGSFPTMIKQWSDTAADAEPDRTKAGVIRRIGAIRHPHNLFLSTWVEAGVPAVLLLAAGLCTLTVSLWRRSNDEAAAATALALLALVLVGAMLAIAEQRVPGALLATAVLIHWSPRKDAARRSD